VAASVFAAVMIFTHTFAFGLLARLDLSGRAMAATPAMLMIGAAIGPILRRHARQGLRLRQHRHRRGADRDALAVWAFTRIPRPAERRDAAGAAA
jgi:hypothetical protein